MRRVAIGLALLPLAGCNLAPRYVRPDLPVPPALPQGAAYPALGEGDGERSADSVGWRAFFTDERLRSVIATALLQNRDLRQTVANVEAARARYRVARSGLFPTIGASAGASIAAGVVANTATGQVQGSGGTRESYTATAALSAYEIDLFGRQRNLSRSAFESYLASEEGRKAAQIALMAEVAQAWLTCAATADALAVARDTLASRSETLRINTRREQLGIGNRLEVAQAQTQLDAARADVADFTTDLAQARNALDVLAGTAIGDALLPSTLGAGDQTLPALPVALSSAVLLRRPDVLRAEHALRAANADIGLARAAFFPTISLTGLLGFASSALSSLFDGDALRKSASGTLAQTLFDGGARSGNLAGARASRDAAVAGYERAIQAAFREVADALARRGTMAEKLAAQESLAANAEAAMRLSQSRYRNGIASYLEPLDAQRTAYAARQALVAARLQRATNLVELYRSLGGGLVP